MEEDRECALESSLADLKLSYNGLLNLHQAAEWRVGMEWNRQQTTMVCVMFGRMEFFRHVRDGNGHLGSAHGTAFKPFAVGDSNAAYHQNRSREPIWLPFEEHRVVRCRGHVHRGPVRWKTAVII